MNLDEEILEEIKKNNIGVFNRFFEDTYYQLYFQCRKMIADPDTAKDLLQNVYLRFWEKRKDIDIRVSLSAYLSRSVRNECLNYIRGQRDMVSLSDSADESWGVVEPAQNENDSPEACLEFFELENRISEVVEQLPEQCRNIFKLSRESGLKNQEIADKLNLSVRTVETQLYRALKNIKNHLYEYLQFLFWLLFLQK